MIQEKAKNSLINWEIVSVNPNDKKWSWIDLFCFWGNNIQSIIAFSLIASLYLVYDLNIEVVGDTHVDLHHTVEDTGYTIAQAIINALGEKKGIRRYGFFYLPMDDCLSRCVIDFSGRPELIWKVGLGLKKIGDMDTELFEEFFKAFTNESKCNLHIENFYGKNNHHIIESCFKAFAKSVRIAIEIDNKIKNIIPSSKGTL